MISGGDAPAAPITDLLRGEHGVLYALLDALGELLLNGDPDGERTARLRMAALLLENVLASHAGLEDTLLVEALAGADPGPVAAMQEEHRGIAALLADLDRVGDDPEAEAVVEELLDTARDHFRREEWAAFPFVEAHAEEDRLRRLGALWAERRGVHFD